MSKLISRAWSIIILVFVGMVVFTFVMDTIRPYMFIIALAFIVVSLSVVTYFVLRLIRGRRQFF